MGHYLEGDPVYAKDWAAPRSMNAVLNYPAQPVRRSPWSAHEWAMVLLASTPVTMVLGLITIVLVK